MGSAVHAAQQRRGILSDADRKTAERLDKFLGGGWWRRHFVRVADEHDDETATDVALRVWQEYEEMLTAGTRYRAVRLPVRARPDLAPKYVLALFTTHSDGAWHFADALGKAGVEWQQAWQEERWRRNEHHTPTLFGDTFRFDPAEYVTANEQRWIGIIERNLDQLLGGGPFRPADRVPEVYGTTLGQAFASHVGSAIKQLHARRRVANAGIGKVWQTLLHRP